MVKFDFILIDGRVRKYCKAYNLLSGKGLVMLRNADRKYYQISFKYYPYKILFTDCRKNPAGL